MRCGDPSSRRSPNSGWSTAAVRRGRWPSVVPRPRRLVRAGAPWRACLATLVVAAILRVPLPLSAQTIAGRVLDESSEGPIGGALLTLVSPDGDEEARALADSAGWFRLVPPEAGEYYLTAERIGYVPTRSPLLSLATDGTAALELMMAPAPVGLEGFDVSVEERVADELRILGLSPTQLGNRWIDRADIEAVAVKRDMGTVLEWQQISGTRIIRPENLAPGSDDMGLCVAMVRARMGRGAGTCALIVWNGVPISGPQALNIDPDAIESMALLLPVEATVFYGSRGGGGALLVWTR